MNSGKNSLLSLVVLVFAFIALMAFTYFRNTFGVSFAVALESAVWASISGLILLASLFFMPSTGKLSNLIPLLMIVAFIVMLPIIKELYSMNEIAIRPNVLLILTFAGSAISHLGLKKLTE